MKLYISAVSDLKHKAIALFSCAVWTMIITSKDAIAAKDAASVVTELVCGLSKQILHLTSAAALVGVGSGAFLKKFSLGKMDRIETGNKLITNSIWGWIIVNGLMSILTWVGKYMDKKPTEVN